MIGNNARNLMIGLFVFVLSGAFGVCAIRGFHWSSAANTPEAADPGMVKLWLDALAAENPKRTILAAERIMAHETGGISKIPPKYLGFAGSGNINSRFFNRVFAPLDFQRWLDAYKFRKLAEPAAADPAKTPERLFALVKSRINIEKYPTGQKRAASPLEAWERGRGDAVDACLVTAAMARQVGLDALAIFLFDDSGKKPPQLLCMIAGSGQVCVCDFINGGYWKAKTWDALVSGLTESGETVPSRVITIMRKGIYATLAPAQDFKPLNQEFHRKLAGSGVKGIPVFGDDPEERRYGLVASARIEVDDSQFVLWPLTFDVIKNSPHFDKKWIAKQDK